MVLAWRRMVLAIFDACVSIVSVGKLLVKPFLEKLGVSEGAVESPHQCNVCIDPLRRRLEVEHPRLRKLMDVLVAVILYADDAGFSEARAKKILIKID